MADTKISALSSATTPLTGAEQIPLVQSGTTKKATAANVAAVANGPAFRAYRTGTQSISSTTFTKVALNDENFDTDNAFDAATNNRFQPALAGYYQINGAVNIAPSVAPTRFLAFIYKNGATYAQGQDFNSIPGSGGTSTISTTVYLNGTTDYVELWTFVIAATAAVGGGDVSTFMDGSFVRQA
jgi:hypothetical protein